MTRSNRIFWLVALLAGTGAAEETIEYAEADGTERSSPVIAVTKDEEKEFSGKILLNGRPKRLDIPARRVISLRRGDQDALNQWSKRLATGKRLVATGQLATQGTVPGAEEMFEKIAYSTEKGLPGEEEAYAALPWHNMYALYYLIETRYQMGLKGDKTKFAQALANVTEFKERSAKRSGATIEIDVPFEKGSTKKGKVFCWGDSRLLPEVLLCEARILAASGEKDKAMAAFDAVIDRIKKSEGSPLLLATAMIDKADFEATGQGSEQQEAIFRAAGQVLAGMSKNQPEDFGKRAISRAANRALLRGADLLRESAEQTKVGWDVPLGRYQTLRDSEGSRDPALLVGAQAGLGACLVEKGQGEAGYKALLSVLVSGQADPEQMALCFYYMGRAAKLFGDEIDRQGGKGDFLRAEADRWWGDLKERYPTSRWAEKAK